MKVLLPLIFLLAFAGCGQPTATSQTKSSADEFTVKHTRLVVSRLLTDRCHKYRPQGFLHAFSCRKAAFDLTRVLDFGQPPKERRPNDGYFGYAAFREKFVELTSSGEMEGLVDALLNGLNESADSVFNVWDASLTHLGGDKARTNLFLGILLQDTLAAAHATFLRHAADGFGPIADKIEALMAALLEHQNNGTATLFPEERFENGRNAYHFYVPSLLAQLMKEEGYDDPMARLMPFLFNTEYEMTFILVDIRYNDLEFAAEEDKDLWDRLKDLVVLGQRLTGAWVPFEPGPQFTPHLQDIASGYGGASFGADLEFEMLPEAIFVEEIPRDPKGVLRKISGTFFEGN